MPDPETKPNVIKGIDPAAPQSNVVEYPYQQMIEKTVGLRDLLVARAELAKIAARMALVKNTVSDLHQLACSVSRALDLAGQAIGPISPESAPGSHKSFPAQSSIQAEGTQAW